MLVGKRVDSTTPTKSARFRRALSKTRFFRFLGSQEEESGSECEISSQSTISADMSCSRDVELALRYLQQVLSSKSPPLILKSSMAVLDAISTHCNNNDRQLQEATIKLLRQVDPSCLKNASELNASEIKSAIDEISQAVAKCAESSSTATSSSYLPSSSTDLNRRSTNSLCSPRGSFPSFGSEISEPQTTAVAEIGQDQNLDELLKQLNLRQVPKFAPAFPDLGGDSDDDTAVTTDERKEERAEKHGQKMCEEEVQQLPDGTQVRRTKTRTVNVQQSSKHVTISTRGGGCPSFTRTFADRTRGGNDDEEESTTDFFGSDPFERLRRREQFTKALEPAEPSSPGQSTKTKTVEQTSEVSQSVSQRKERNGRILGEHAAQKIDNSELKARQTDTFLGEILLDRKGDGSYEESSIVRRGLPDADNCPTAPPKKHVVEYMQTFGNKENTDVDFFFGTTLSSYITLNDSLRFHEEQFRKKLHFEFSAAGSSNFTPDFSNLADILEATDFARIQLPTKWSIGDEDEEPKSTRAIDWQEKAALPAAPETICAVDALDYLVMRKRDDGVRPVEVRGGPRDALIVYATQSGVSLVYQEAFLVTYRTFISSHDLINKLIKRYLYMAVSPDRASQLASRNTFSVVVRVVDELCGVELQPALIDSVTSFIYRLIRDGNFTFARILRKRLVDRIEEPKLPKSLISRLSPPRKHLSLFDFRSTDIACQMTIVDSELFQLIEPAELLWWSQEQDEKKSPNLVRFTEHFNKVSFWVRSLVISQVNAKDREKHMSKFIKIMKQLRRIGNFNSYLAVLSALVSSPLARLEWGKSTTDVLKEHSAVMDTSHSYKNYRALLQQATPPCVPYIGVVLQDLTFVHAGNPDKIPADRVEGRKDMVNFLKRWHQYAILDSIRKLKRWNYEFRRDEKVIQFFNCFTNYLTEEETWLRSHEIKPTNRKQT